MLGSVLCRERRPQGRPD